VGVSDHVAQSGLGESERASATSGKERRSLKIPVQEAYGLTCCVDGKEAGTGKGL
jgi:hypothetical protein